MAASTTSSSPLPNIVIHLIGPDDASALERQLWDQIYKHVNIPANAETSQSDIIGNHTTGNLNNIEMSPDSPTATLVDPNEPIPKWHVENNLAESVTPAIGHMPFAQGSTSAGGGGGFRQDSHGQYINPNHSVHYPRRGTATNVNVRFGAYTMIMVCHF
ncbi:hypothetical protein C2E23DRAFT_34051 [Lenzites betulinus]|nr:hypothetical protein C2E23DRAFT_34051 [Lenzites betulinus]